jgi:hypothetical protein
MGNITDERETQSDVEQVKERVQDVAEQAKGQTRDQLRTQIDERTTQVGEEVSSAARAFRQAAEQLRQEGSGRAGSLVETVAERGERLGSYLSGADGESVLREVEEFARRQPWVVAGAGVIAGFLGARFVKASSRSRYQVATAPRSTYDRAAAIPTAGGSSGVR